MIPTNSLIFQSSSCVRRRKPQEKPLQGTEPENVTETKQRGQHVKTQDIKKTILGRSSERKIICKLLGPWGEGGQQRLF